MPGINANIIRNLVEQIKEEIEVLKQTKKGRKKLNNLGAMKVINKITINRNYEFDPKKWQLLDEDQQRYIYDRLSCILNATIASLQPSKYITALIATMIFLPGTAMIFTLLLVLLNDSSDQKLIIPSQYFPLAGMAIAFVAWLGLSWLFRWFAEAKHAIPSSYGELLPRLDELEATLTTAGFPNHPCANPAYYAAVKQYQQIRRDLRERGRTWVLATGYVKVWERLYRAEEAMIEFVPQKAVLKIALYDEARLEGSDIENRDDLLVKLRKAIVSIDPSANKYLKSTASVTIPPALAIGTTALPQGTVAADYCVALLATGGTPPYLWQVIGGAIPEWLFFSTAGILRGTPTNDGHGNFIVRVTDSANVAVEKYFDLLISPQNQATPSPLAISTMTPLPAGIANVEYEERLFATGGTPPYQWEVIAGKIPDGLCLSASGLLKGRPATENSYKFTVNVTENSGNFATRKFTLSIKPTGVSAVAPVGGAEPEQKSRSVLSQVRHAINEYRNSRWKGLVFVRNRLLGTFTLTATVIFALLTIAIMDGANRNTVIAATVFYLVGATTGLYSRLHSAFQVESAIGDYGLSAARLITIPLFSGVGGIIGVLFVALVPFFNPVFGPGANKQLIRLTPIVGTAGKIDVKTPAQVSASVKNAGVKIPAPASVPARKAAGKGPAPTARGVEKPAPKAPIQVMGALEKTLIIGSVASNELPLRVEPLKYLNNNAFGKQGVYSRPHQVANAVSEVPETIPSKTPAQPGDDKPKLSTDEKAPEKTPEQIPEKTSEKLRMLEVIFSLEKNLNGLFVAAVFGLMPGLLLDRLLRQTYRYESDLKSSSPTERSEKT